MRELACPYSASLSQFPVFNWNHNTQSYLLPSLSQGSEIVKSAACLSGMKTALQPCTLCLGQEMGALKLSMTDPEATAGIMSHWHWRMTWVIPWSWCLYGQQTQKSSSFCSKSCCLYHHARHTNTIICPVMRTSPTLSSSNTWNPLGVGMEKIICSIYIQKLSYQYFPSHCTSKISTESTQKKTLKTVKVVGKYIQLQKLHTIRKFLPLYYLSIFICWVSKY